VSRNAAPSTLSNFAGPSIHHQFVDGLWYYHRPQYDPYPPDIYSELLQTAQNEIKIWDPYMNKDDEIIFGNIPNNTTLHILWSKGIGNSPTDPTRVAELARASDIRINITATSVYVIARILNLKTKRDWGFHERFLFLDDKVFSIGASLSHHVSSKETTTVTEIKSADARHLLTIRFQEMWSLSDNVEVMNEQVN
jgi:hypothetical protein